MDEVYTSPVILRAALALWEKHACTTSNDGRPGSLYIGDTAIGLVSVRVQHTTARYRTFYLNRAGEVVHERG